MKTFTCSKMNVIGLPLNTAKNTVISPDFLVWKICGKGDSSETMRKLCLSAKLPHQKIRWNYVIFRSARKWTVLRWKFYAEYKYSDHTQKKPSSVSSTLFHPTDLDLRCWITRFFISYPFFQLSLRVT